MQSDKLKGIQARLSHEVDTQNIPVFPMSCAEFVPLDDAHARPGTPTCITCGRTKATHTGPIGQSVDVESLAPARSGMLVVSIPGVLDPLASKLDEAPRIFNEDEARRALAPIVAAFKTQGEPYALDAWPNEDEL